jgi:hypothetical protein
VLILRGGITSYTSGTPKLISFQRPDGTEIGNVAQTSSTSVAFNTSSDSTLKKNIRPTHYTLDTLMKIKVVDFNWKCDPDNGKLMNGFIAQDLYKLYPDAVSKPEDNSGDKWQMSREAMVPLLVKSIQDQQAIIKAQQAQINALLQRVHALDGQ